MPILTLWSGSPTLPIRRNIPRLYADCADHDVRWSGRKAQTMLQKFRSSDGLGKQLMVCSWYSIGESGKHAHHVKIAHILHRTIRPLKG